MEGEQKRTYLVYSRGLAPEDLRLGSLYLDPLNPLEGEYKKFENVVPDPVLEGYTRAQQVEKDLELTFKASRQWLINSGLFNLLSGELRRQKSQEIKIAGASGRRLEIKRPNTFLNDVILKSQPAKVWLAQQLSISRRVYYLSQTPFGLVKLPRIWLVTGLQYVTKAEVATTRAQSNKVSASANVPIPEPIAVATTILGGSEGVAAGFENEQSGQMSTSYRHDDERVWAAQFTQLSVRFSPTPVSADDMPTRIPLHDLVDLKNKGARVEAGMAGKSLDEESAELLIQDEEVMMQIDGEDLINLMQDVDWSFMEQFLEPST